MVAQLSVQRDDIPPPPIESEERAVAARDTTTSSQGRAKNTSMWPQVVGDQSTTGGQELSRLTLTPFCRTRDFFRLTGSE